MSIMRALKVCYAVSIVRQCSRRHFGEAPPPCSSMCDVCSASASGHAPERRDISAAALAVVRTLAEWPGAEKRATLIQLIDRWRASKMPADAKIGKGMSREENERVIAQLLYDGYLQFDFSYTAYATNVYLKASQRASLILQGKLWLPLHPCYRASLLLLACGTVKSVLALLHNCR